MVGKEIKFNVQIIPLIFYPNQDKFVLYIRYYINKEYLNILLIRFKNQKMFVVLFIFKIIVYKSVCIENEMKKKNKKKLFQFHCTTVCLEYAQLK